MSKHAPDEPTPVFAEITEQQWRRRVEDGLKGASFEEALVTHSRDGVAIKPLYSAGDNLSGPASRPGAMPYTRGRALQDGSAASWRVVTRIDQPELEQARSEIRHDLACGAEGLRLQFDRATRAGRDTDDPAIATFAAQGGIALSSAQQLEELLEDVALDEVALHLDAGANALPVAAGLIAVARRRGINPCDLRGTLGFDPFASLASEGRLPGALHSSWRELASLAHWTATHAPLLRAVTVSAVPYVAAGANQVQALAWSVATGIAYLRALESSGLPLETAFQQIAFTFAADRDFFGTVASLRAARTLWGRVAEACGVHSAEAAMWMQVETSDRTLTVQDPWGNILRTTTQGFAAVAGGAQSVVVSPYDRRLGASDAQARRLAVNTQHVLRSESHIDRVADPAGGSHYVEALTEQLAERAWALMQEIEAEGGMASALSSGRIVTAVNASSAAWRDSLVSGEASIIGVNVYPPTDPVELHRQASDTSAVLARAESFLAAHRLRHDQVRAVASLTAYLSASGRVVEETSDPMGLTDAVIEVVMEGATLTSLCSLLRSGESPASAPRLEPWSDASLFEGTERGQA
jgi:methylmalonyl-CoA mutase